MTWGNVSGWCPKERINCNSYTDWGPFQKDQQDSLSADVTQITVPVHVQLKAPKSFRFSNTEPEEQLQDMASNTNLGCPLRCKICKLGGFTHPWHGTQSRLVYKCKNRSTDTLLRSQWSCGNTGLESWFSFIPHIPEGYDKRAGYSTEQLMAHLRTLCGNFDSSSAFQVLCLINHINRSCCILNTDTEIGVFKNYSQDKSQEWKRRLDRMKTLSQTS